MRKIETMIKKSAGDISNSVTCINYYLEILK